MTKKFMLGAALSALMLSGAFAQTPKSTVSTPQPPAAKTDQAKPAKAAQSKPATGQANIVMSQKPSQWLASNFKGTDVVGQNGKKIGDVSDVLFDKKGAKIEAYVVSMGGFLGMGAKQVAIAPSSFRVVPGSNGKADKLKLSMTKNEMKQAQNFKPYQKPKPVTTGSAMHSPMGGSASPLGGGVGAPQH